MTPQRPRYQRFPWPDWAYPPERLDLKALRDGGLIVRTPADAAPGVALAATTLIQTDGDITTTWSDVRPSMYVADHHRAVADAIRGLVPSGRVWDWLGRVMWVGPITEAGLIGWDLGTNGWKPGRLAELLWQSGWLGGSVGLTALSWLGRKLIKRKLQSLLSG
jgi:hypothetical protein